MSISQEVLDFQLKALYPVQIEKEPARINLVFLNHDRNFSTFLTIRYLVQHERVADIYALSRSIFESIITMGLLSKRLIEEDIERYQNFQFIEVYKTYNHLKRLGLEHLVEFHLQMQSFYIRNEKNISKNGVKIHYLGVVNLWNKMLS